MASYPRTRERDLSFVTSGQGTSLYVRYKDGSPYWDYSSEKPYSGDLIRTGYEYCEDSVSDTHPYPDQGFLHYRKTCKVGSLTGEDIYQEPTSTGWSWLRGNSYQNYVHPYWADVTYGPDPTNSVPWAYLMTKALANANPSVPDIDVPLFLFELKDFPRMLRDIGKVLSGRASVADVPGGFLGYQFGWKPLISDAETLGALAESVNQRLQNLKDIRKGKKIRRSLGTSDSSWVDSSLAGDPVGGSRAFTEQTENWFTMKYIITDQNKFRDESDMINVWKRTLGLNLSYSTIWNMLPWSWLIDYFLGISALLEAGRGSLPLHASSMCIMSKTVAKVRPESTEPINGVKFDPYEFKTVSQNRYCTPTPRPMLSLVPLINKRQLAILGALILAGPSRAYKS